MGKQIARVLYEKLVLVNSILKREIIAANKKDIKTIVSSLGSKIDSAKALDDAWRNWLTMCCDTPEICAAISMVIRIRIFEQLVELHQNFRSNYDALQQLYDEGCTSKAVRASLFLVTPPPIEEAEVIHVKFGKR